MNYTKEEYQRVSAFILMCKTNKDTETMFKSMTLKDLKDVLLTYRENLLLLEIIDKNKLYNRA